MLMPCRIRCRHTLRSHATPRRHDTYAIDVAMLDVVTIHASLLMLPARR